MKRKAKKKSDTNAIKSKETSLEDSQGSSTFSGSAYNAPGKVDHGKKTSNKKRR